MNPEGDKILTLSAARLATTVAPLLSEVYAQSAIGLTNFMLTLVAQEYERAADLRVNENASIRGLFDELVPLVTDPQLKAKLLAAAATKDLSLKISALNAANYDLRRLLTALHVHVEEHEGAKARAAERRIWQLLKAIAEHRTVRLMP